MKTSSFFLAVLVTSSLFSPLASVHAAGASTVSPAPSVEIIYRIKAKKGILSIAGQGSAQWKLLDKQYSLQNTARANFFGKMQESSSQGSVNEAGLQPNLFTETRYRKEMTSTTFAREQKQIQFSEGAPSIALPNAAQDRASVVWQLAATARANPEKFQVGAEWSSYVAGRRDAETWRFKVISKETLSTPLGDIASVHLVKAPPPDSQEQQVDLWLAPSMEWLPVQIRFKDADGDFVEQTVERVLRK